MTTIVLEFLLSLFPFFSIYSDILVQQIAQGALIFVPPHFISFLGASVCL